MHRETVVQRSPGGTATDALRAGAGAAAANNSLAIAGPCSSTPALALAPLVDAAKVPVMLTTAGTPELIGPEWIFRGSIPQAYYVGRVIQVLAGMGIKKLYVIWQTDNP